MTNQRRVIKYLCSSLCSRLSTEESFDSDLLELQGNLNKLAAEGKYTILASAQASLDECVTKASLAADRIIRIADMFPLSLSTCSAIAISGEPNLAIALAKNIVRHEDFHNSETIAIEEFIVDFVEQGYSEAVTILFEGLIDVSFNSSDFHHAALVSPLFTACENSVSRIIEWALVNEDRIMDTDIRYDLDKKWVAQYQGNMFYKSGLKKLGAAIMKQCPESCEDLELFERELFTGHGITPENPKSDNLNAVVAYLLGTPNLTHEWFGTTLKDFPGRLLEKNISELRMIGVNITNERIELVGSIMIATSSNLENIKSVNKSLDALRIVPSKELLEIAYNHAMPKVWVTMEQLAAFHAVTSSYQVQVDYKDVSEKIDKAFERWSQSKNLTHAPALALFMSDCVNGFPVSHSGLATIIDSNWDKWNPRERSLLHVNAPKQAALLSKYMKSMELEDAMGL